MDQTAKTQINNVIWVAETKVGKDTAKYLRELLATPSFRHNSIVNADQETLEWAAALDTVSTCPMDTCQECIEWEDMVEKLVTDGRELMIVFTDGSANVTNADDLAYGGWGFFIHRDSNQNKGELSQGSQPPATERRCVQYST